MDDPWSALILLIILLIFSAFFSGMEIAFISANRLKIELDKKQGKRPARILSRFVRKPQHFIASMLVGNNIALTWYSIVAGGLILFLTTRIGASLSWAWTQDLVAQEGPAEINWWFMLVQTLISTIIVLFAAEFMPKAVFSARPNIWLNRLAYPLQFINGILWLPAAIVTALSNTFIRSVLKKDTENEEVAFGKTDLSYFLAEATAKAADPEDLDHEIQLVQNALDFTDVKARDCMVPRTEIAALEVNDSIANLRTLFSETGYSKIVIYRDSIDNIIGYVHSFELFKQPEAITNILLPPSIVPEPMTAQEVLELLIRQKRNLAVVVDEFGGTSGILTVEDIVEEIFGEIQDEFDDEGLLEEQIEEGEFLLSARHEIDQLNEKYRLNLPENDDYETLGGLIVHLCEDIPEEGAVIEDGPHRFTIRKVSDTRIEEVLLQVQS